MKIYEDAMLKTALKLSVAVKLGQLSPNSEYHKQLAALRIFAISRSPVGSFALLNMVSSLNKYKYPHLHAGKLKSAAMCYHHHHPAMAPD